MAVYAVGIALSLWVLHFDSWIVWAAALAAGVAVFIAGVVDAARKARARQAG